MAEPRPWVCSEALKNNKINHIIAVALFLGFGEKKRVLTLIKEPQKLNGSGALI